MKNKWEVTIKPLTNGQYKVTRRLPDMQVAETKMFTDRKEALKQVEEWSH